MTTSDLIELLQSVEYGSGGLPRKISIDAELEYYPNPEIGIFATADGNICPELCLSIKGTYRNNQTGEVIE